MELDYKVSIVDPHQHQLKVVISGVRDKSQKTLSFFLPSWSPGSYLMREYARHVAKFNATNSFGEQLFFEQTAKGTWQVDWGESELVQDNEKFEITYWVYCHELTVRTSHIDNDHAFLHGPSYLMGVVGQDMVNLTLQLDFPAFWSKVSTGLQDISDKREIFLYAAKSYDDLIDCPIEIGNHETTGFAVAGVNHYLAFYGKTLPHKCPLVADIQTIVEHISQAMGEIPYSDYTFITHFVPNLYGGLEHKNSTALHFDALKLNDRKSYLNWLCLVSHEYFHTWNVKRIRPKELGPFQYTEENYSKMLWLAEGLTVFMDELFVLRAGLMGLEEYLDLQRAYINRYGRIAGRKFDSLEASSFNAWVKLYRPDENSENATISYYLKGGLAFFQLNVLLHEHGKDMQDLLNLLWKSYKNRPQQGCSEEEVFTIVEDLTNKDVREKFEIMIKTTEEYDLELYCQKMGLIFVWAEQKKPWIGAVVRYSGERVFVKTVELDGPAYKYGLNCGDEVLAINGLRVTKSTHKEIDKILLVETSYTFTISRLDQLRDIEIVVGKTPRYLQKIEIADEARVKEILLSGV